MTIQLFNTLRRTKEPLVPRDEGRVGMYVCGPTVYNFIHIGNARTFVSFDVIRRYLIYRGLDVTFVQNLTDVDDKIIDRAREEGRTPEEVAVDYSRAFTEDMGHLSVLPPDIAPKATEHIDEMLVAIQALVERDHAYPVEGDVYFSVESFEGYGKLSGRSLEEMRAGERVEVDPRKRHPMDFALWKASKPGEPAWDSPWGPGRPGWHIECSVMSGKYLGMSFDIHGGAQDLIFPHHENEVAQAEAATGREPFVRTWLHAGFLNMAEEKMSKSVGNIIRLRDLLTADWRRENGLALGSAGDIADEFRLMVLGTHYRQPLEFSLESLKAARSELEGLKNPFIRAGNLQKPREKAEPLGEPAEVFRSAVRAAGDRFLAAMDDDFNSGAGLAVLHEIRQAANHYLDRLEHRGDELASQDLMALNEGMSVLAELARQVFGLQLEMPQAVTVRRTTAAGVAVNVPSGERVEALIGTLPNAANDEQTAVAQELAEAREALRDAKDFAQADRVREALQAAGYVVEDTPQGPRVYRSA